MKEAAKLCAIMMLNSFVIKLDDNEQSYDHIKNVCIFSDPTLKRSQRLGWYGWVDVPHTNIDGTIDEYQIRPGYNTLGTAIDILSRDFSSDYIDQFEEVFGNYEKYIDEYNLPLYDEDLDELEAQIEKHRLSYFKE